MNSTPDSPPTLRSPGRIERVFQTPPKFPLLFLSAFINLLLIGVFSSVFPNFNARNGVMENVRRSTEAANLRSIGQSMQTYAEMNAGALPSAGSSDLYEVAAQLARAKVMTDPKLWFSKVDKNYPAPMEFPEILLPAAKLGDVKPINPKFQGAPLAFAVALFPAGTRIADLPPTTPVAWTRGLQLNGTWSEKLGTYGNWGGHIVFLNGSITTFQGSIQDKLIAYGTEKPTSNIQETLPPGTRIGEFKPAP